MSNEPYPQYPPSYPPPSYPPPNPGYPGYPPQPNPPYAVQPQYYAPQMMPMSVQTSGWSIASLVCSLVGVHILGIIFGFVALNEIKNSGGRMGGEGLAKAGIIIGFIFTGLTILFVLFYVIVIIIAAGAAATAPSGLLGLLA